jgi:hypothetical protein
MYWVHWLRSAGAKLARNPVSICYDYATTLHALDHNVNPAHNAEAFSVKDTTVTIGPNQGLLVTGLGLRLLH